MRETHIHFDCVNILKYDNGFAMTARKLDFIHGPEPANDFDIGRHDRL